MEGGDPKGNEINYTARKLPPPDQTKPNQTTPNQIKTNQSKPKQTELNQAAFCSIVHDGSCVHFRWKLEKYKAPAFVGGPYEIWGLTGYILHRLVNDVIRQHLAVK